MLHRVRPHALVGKIQWWASRVFLVVMCEMDYFSSLNAIGQQRYMDKLRLLDLSLADDPYTVANSINFVKDMSHWPPIEYGHIFCYFVDRPGVYTRQQMLQWKQLDAYNYFTSAFVRTVEIWDLRNTSECVILKALVNSSMRNPVNAHSSAWVATKKSGDI